MIDDTTIDEETIGAVLARVADAEPVSAAAMARLLDALHETESDPAAPGTHPRRFGRDGGRARSHRRLAVMGAAVSVVLVAGAFGSALGAAGPSSQKTVSAISSPSGRGAANGSTRSSSGLATPSVTAPPAAPPAASAASSGLADGVAPSSGTAVIGAGAPATVPSPADATRVVKNGQIDLVVGHGRVGPVIDQISLLGVAQGGFVSSTTTDLGDGAPSGTVVVSVPEAQFDLVVDQVRRLGRVEQLSTSGQDVTSRYVDLQAQISAAQQAEQRYLAILGQASSIGDILSVQQQIDTIDTQLQQLQGPQQLLDDQTTYGTLSVSVAESPRVLIVTPVSGWSRAWRNAAHGFAAAAEGVVSALGVPVFVGLCLAAVIGGVWVAWRRVRPRMV